LFKGSFPFLNPLALTLIGNRLALSSLASARIDVGKNHWLVLEDVGELAGELGVRPRCLYK
jgi:hypothetical protein